MQSRKEYRANEAENSAPFLSELFLFPQESKQSFWIILIEYSQDRSNRMLRNTSMTGI